MTSNKQPGRTGDLVVVGADAIDSARLIEFVTTPQCGAVCLFLGTVRDHSRGKEGVTHLEYEAYDDVVEVKIQDIVDEARNKWSIERIAAVHRVGSLHVGESSVAVAVSSGHRKESFAAAQYVIDELKARVPIWKKEHWPGGAEWVREDLEHGSAGH
ncbi:MAG: molybdenum cofactor biosynthesis protein MoaE [Acidimicrobiia bacterium]|nr:molybdenum cofactor biosynthesis protein MoaE [Acidimicrobiia bacterium]MDX2467605.1 molybdenum cofactor biosynthesis protein MoaE [Acidimicrobiia bacterium]